MTIIDTLGILMPGAILTLAINHYQLCDLTVPWQEFFGQGELSILIYFVGLSYLLGSIIHQMGYTLEGCLSSGPLKKYNMHKRYWNDETVQKTYKKVFLEEPPVNSSEKSEENLREEQIAAGKKIFHAIQQNHRPSRIVLFCAFFTMSRTMVLTFICAFFMSIFTGNANLLTSAGYLIGIIVFAYRWIQYEHRCIAETYLYFTQNSREITKNQKEGAVQ